MRDNAQKNSTEYIGQNRINLPDNFDAYIKLSCKECGSALTEINLGKEIVIFCAVCFQHLESISFPGCCEEPNLGLRKVKLSNGTIQVKHQCKKCGNSAGCAVKYKNTNIDINAIEWFDDDLKSRVEQERELIRINFWEQFNAGRSAYHERQSEKWHQDTQERRRIYFASAAWKLKRMKVFERDQYMCQSCFNTKATEVHHLNYDHFGNEPLFDLISICRYCHQQVTNMDKNLDYNAIH